METIKRTEYIDAPPAKIFDYLADTKNLPEVWPSMIEISNVKTRPDGTTESNDSTYKMAGVKLHGHTEVEVERDKLIWRWTS